MNEKDVEAFQAILRLSNNFEKENILKGNSPFDHLYNRNESEAVEIILKSMYGPNMDDYNWIGISDEKFEIVEKSLELFLNLRGKWLELEIDKYSKPKYFFRKVEPINLPKPNRLFKFSDLLLFAPGILISIFMLNVILPMSPSIISFFVSLFLSPYSICSGLILVYLLILEAFSGFKEEGWLVRVLLIYYHLTLIFAFVGEIFSSITGGESYLF